MSHLKEGEAKQVKIHPFWHIVLPVAVALAIGLCLKAFVWSGHDQVRHDATPAVTDSCAGQQFDTCDLWANGSDDGIYAPNCLWMTCGFPTDDAVVGTVPDGGSVWGAVSGLVARYEASLLANGQTAEVARLVNQLGTQVPDVDSVPAGFRFRIMDGGKTIAPYMDYDVDHYMGLLKTQIAVADTPQAMHDAYWNVSCTVMRETAPYGAVSDDDPGVAFDAQFGVAAWQYLQDEKPYDEGQFVGQDVFRMMNHAENGDPLC